MKCKLSVVSLLCLLTLMVTVFESEAQGIDPSFIDAHDRRVAKQLANANYGFVGIAIMVFTIAIGTFISIWLTQKYSKKQISKIYKRRSKPCEH